MMRARERKKPHRRLLDAARVHQVELEAAGLPPRAIESYEVALRGATQARAASAAAKVLVRDIQREVEEFQAAIRKEFPANPSFQAVFKAQERMPAEAREVLALGRHVAREAQGYAHNLIKYAINAATVRHLVALCDQLEGELGGPDPVQRARTIEEQIVAAAQRAFAGRPELAAFEPKPSP
jgi:hypothetical protein